MLMANHAALLTALMLAMGGFSSLAFAHGGGLDKNGCHNNRKTGEYHCHRAPALAPAPSLNAASPQPQVRNSQQPSYVDDTCYTGPRGGRYRIVNGKKRYGC